MSAPTDLPDYFTDTFPGGFKDWWNRAWFRVINYLLCRLVRYKKNFKHPLSDKIIVLGFDQVQEVFSRSDDFPVPHDSKTNVLEWNPPFLLAVRYDDPGYQDMHRQIREIFADDTLKASLRSTAYNTYYDLLPDPQDEWGEIDLGWDYTYRGFLQIFNEYYGIDFLTEDDRVEFICACLVVSAYFFATPEANEKPRIKNAAIAAFNKAWQLVGERVQYYKNNPGEARGAMILALKPSNNLDVRTLTSYFFGMMLGCVPTNGNAHARILEVLLNNPTARAWAERYAEGAPDADKDPEFLAVLHEALRRNYILPGLWRVAVKDKLVIGRQSNAPRHVPRDFALLVSGLAAMHDPDHIDEPFKFRPDRSYWSYLNYGHQMHFCVGWDLSNIIMTEYFRALIIRKFELKPGGTNKLRSTFPWHTDARYKAPESALAPLPGP